MKPIATVHVTRTELTLPTYLPMAPDRNPMFLEKRVYQGSSGRVYPLPFTDRIAEKPVDRAWQAVWIENEYLRVLVLPELGGRIHAIQDKTNGYDLVYRQDVIKPALVGLAGPWLSGGIEFNWPQHHRPATFLPTDIEVETGADGSVTVWCSDHDPLTRMKGMHGVCLHPGRAYVELKARAYNRTPWVQTFLWWANVATRVHQAYQSFFPPDVYYVADHARRSMSEYPLAQGHYYGVNYGERGQQGIPAAELPAQYLPPHAGGQAPVNYAPNDLSFYANIPTPCSYMCMGSREDFFGGYDHAAQAGIVHVANHHISPGKKQWTWGNHEFGYAWDRNLTDPDAQGECAPYIEIMAGVYTDNQPDFAFLQPGETKSWSQYWYPIQKIGPARHANLEAALNLSVQGKNIHWGIAVTQPLAGAEIRLTAKTKTKRPGKELLRQRADLQPGQPQMDTLPLPARLSLTDLCLTVQTADGREVIRYEPTAPKAETVPPAATEPAAPAGIASNDELYLTGLHLEQYRHATRCPSLYWQEAIRRDPQDSRCRLALGRWHLQRGEWSVAEAHFRMAIARQTRRNANPYDGEALYYLGLCLQYQDRLNEAYDAFYKACWNQAWMSAGYHALAELDCGRQQWATALEHLDRSLRYDTENLRVRCLRAMVLTRLDRATEAAAQIAANRQLDPLDWWTRRLAGESLPCDLQVHLDLAHDLARAGFLDEAIQLLRSAKASVRTLPDQSWGAQPLVLYTLAWLLEKSGDQVAARQAYAAAAAADPTYCFPARLEEILVLTAAIRRQPRDARAHYYLGNLLYDRRRHAEALQHWEHSARYDKTFATVWRNLGIGYLNIQNRPAAARAAYEKALRLAPADARLVFERDQLWKRLGESPARRLRELTRRLDQVRERDDLSVELAALYNQTGRHAEALALVSHRNFQPWEGGEGGPLGQWMRSHLALGRQALATGNHTLATEHFTAALQAPRNLGEAKHLLANQSDIHYWLGCALAAAGDVASARRHWLSAAQFKGDFQEMSVRTFSEMTYYSALSWQKLGQGGKAKKLLQALADYSRQLQRTEARIDYFATSLPTMLLFNDDLTQRQQTTGLFLQAQAQLGLGRRQAGQQTLRSVLRLDPNHPLASDLLAA
ncbi:MAG TPA: DUF5107 domain-containing protein [Verrucomicrobiae bacterium]